MKIKVNAYTNVLTLDINDFILTKWPDSSKKDGTAYGIVIDSRFPIVKSTWDIDKKEYERLEQLLLDGYNPYPLDPAYTGIQP